METRIFTSTFTLIAVAAVLLVTGRCLAQSDIDGPPIHYYDTKPTDAVSSLQQQIESGKESLKWSEEHGWLPAVLDALAVPRSSQTLVFSKTSLQFTRITPSRPRALYFNDDIYVGWVQGGDVVELAAVDVNLGATFYTIKQEKSKQPWIVRDQGSCMSCHQNSRTKNIPGFLVRSLYTESSGQPAYQLGSLTTDHTSPFKDRFGGWFVTGNHGDMRHRGNVVVSDDSDDPLNREAGANLAQLPDIVRSKAYLEPGSDVVALMVLQHQTQMHNLVTKAMYTAKQAIHQQRTMNRILDRPADFQSESTTRRINSAVEALLGYMFFTGEFELTSPVSGSAAFQKSFAAMGPRDNQGRSLRDFDLKTRMFRYPCSFLIYSDSVNALPPLVLTRLKKRTLEILSGKDETETFAHLSSLDRRNILAILSETHPLFKNAAAESP